MISFPVNLFKDKYIDNLVKFQYVPYGYSKYYEPYDAAPTKEYKIFNQLRMNLFQILLKPYKKIPEKYQLKWKEVYNTLKYQIYDDNLGLIFINKNFDDNVSNAFINGNGKWKADLLRFCLLSKYSGLYVDVDMTPEKNMMEYIPSDVDFVSSIGAFCYSSNKKEIQIALLMAKTPEPLLESLIQEIGPDKVSAGNPYAVNISGFYSFLCKRWNVDTLEAFKIYTDPINKRKYYFLKEVETRENGIRKFKIVDNQNNVLINSQELKHSIFR